MKLSNLKPNPKNPRTIRDDNFLKLVKSIQEFPEMMEKRPIVCVTDTDGKLYPLGGNMRLKALLEIGYKDIPNTWVTLADDWTVEKRNEFVIKDNVGFGDWDWEQLSNEWDSDLLSDWGLDIPDWSAGMDVNSMTDEDVDLNEEFDPIGVSAGQQRVVFIFDGSEEAESYLKNISVDFVKRNMAWQVDMTTKIKDE